MSEYEEIPCKGLKEDGSPCDKTVCYKPDIVSGTSRIHAVEDDNEPFVAYITCEDGHNFPYTIKPKK
ncbi:hypothetical protein ACFLS4_05510 [Bacteroidota bacterium]